MSSEAEPASRGESATPFFVTCGADSLIKIWEHNLYRIKDPESSKDKKPEADSGSKDSQSNKEAISGSKDSQSNKGRRSIRMVSEEWRKKVLEADPSNKA